MDNNSEQNVEIMDVENFRNDKIQTFNHQALVMMAMSRALEAGSHELRQGWTNEKYDRGGNVSFNYVESTQKKFIESVESLLDIMYCDFDTEGKTAIEKELKDLKKIKEDLLKQQLEWWNNLEYNQRKIFISKGSEIFPNFFNTSLGWWAMYCDAEVKAYRKILRELSMITKRLGFYKTENWEG